MEMTITKAIEVAKMCTKRASEIKDYRLKKADKVRKAQAVELANGKGYIVATAEELGMKKDGRKHIWCYYNDCPNVSGKVSISLVMVR